jgi:hypothetical protein
MLCSYLFRGNLLAFRHVLQVATRRRPLELTTSAGNFSKADRCHVFRLELSDTMRELSGTRVVGEVTHGSICSLWFLVSRIDIGLNLNDLSLTVD